jgi:hypothetical protein
MPVCITNNIIQINFQNNENNNNNKIENSVCSKYEKSI